MQHDGKYTQYFVVWGNKVSNWFPYSLLFYHHILPLLVSFLGINRRKYEQGSKIQNFLCISSCLSSADGSWRTDLLLPGLWGCSCIGDWRGLESRVFSRQSQHSAVMVCSKRFCLCSIFDILICLLQPAISLPFNKHVF